MADDSPANGQNGRHETRNGRLSLPADQKASAFRAALIAAVSEEDIQAIAAALVAAAREGNVAAARIVLSYTIGKPFGKGDVQIECPPPDHFIPPPSHPVNPVPEPFAALGERLTPRARAEMRRAERKRLKAERKKSRRDQLSRMDDRGPRNGSTESGPAVLGAGPHSPAASG
jgi:hypothetical protein